MIYHRCCGPVITDLNQSLEILRYSDFDTATAPKETRKPPIFYSCCFITEKRMRNVCPGLGRKYLVYTLARPLSPVPITSDEKNQVEQTKNKSQTRPTVIN